MSTGLIPFSAQPTQQQQVESLQRELHARDREVADLQEALRIERQKSSQFAHGAQELRSILQPLYLSLQHVFSEIDAMGPASATPAAKSNPAWEQWKRRLGGATARAIDALMVHGEMNQTQLRIILGCATRTVTNVVAALNQAKLIDKRDGKIRLKEL